MRLRERRSKTGGREGAWTGRRPGGSLEVSCEGDGLGSGEVRVRGVYTLGGLCQKQTPHPPATTPQVQILGSVGGTAS